MNLKRIGIAVAIATLGMVGVANAGGDYCFPLTGGGELVAKSFKSSLWS